MSCHFPPLPEPRRPPSRNQVLSQRPRQPGESPAGSVTVRGRGRSLAKLLRWLVLAAALLCAGAKGCGKGTPTSYRPHSPEIAQRIGELERQLYDFPADAALTNTYYRFPLPPEKQAAIGKELAQIALEDGRYFDAVYQALKLRDEFPEGHTHAFSADIIENALAGARAERSPKSARKADAEANKALDDPHFEYRNRIDTLKRQIELNPAAEERFEPYTQSRDDRIKMLCNAIVNHWKTAISPSFVPAHRTNPDYYRTELRLYKTGFTFCEDELQHTTDPERKALLEHACEEYRKGIEFNQEGYEEAREQLDPDAQPPTMPPVPLS